MSGTNKVIILISCVAVLAIIFFAIFNTSQQQSNTNTQNVSATNNNLPGLQIGNTPWIAEINYLKNRLTAISLPALSAEGTTLHTHQHIDIFINGKAIPVPADIGINVSAGFISPIHTHDTTGIIHVESPTIQKFTLGQFFDIWGVRLTENSIGGYSNNASSTLIAYVNGQKFSGNPRDIELISHEEIVLSYESPNETPVIPKTYPFPPDL